MKFDPSPTAIWKKYERDRDYKRSIGLYDRVRRNEAFYLGRQWEGLRVQSLDPLIFNVLRRCVNLFVAMLVSDDVAVRAQPFDMDKDGRQTAHVLERAFASAIERSGVKALGRPLLKNACVDGDACFYMHFDPALETGQAVKGDIAVELIDSTNICFGNAACDEVQRQPYIIIAMRRDADEVRREARANGISASDAEAIRPDDVGEYHRYRTSSRQRPRDRTAAYAQDRERHCLLQDHAECRCHARKGASLSAVSGDASVLEPRARLVPRRKSADRGHSEPDRHQQAVLDVRPVHQAGGVP